MFECSVSMFDFSEVYGVTRKNTFTSSISKRYWLAFFRMFLSNNNRTLCFEIAKIMAKQFHTGLGTGVVWCEVKYIQGGFI